LKTQDDFERFDADHPAIWSAFEAKALDKRNDKSLSKLSASELFEDMRRDKSGEPLGTNDYKPFYARKFNAKYRHDGGTVFKTSRTPNDLTT